MTQTGLRMDQAAMIYEALTSSRRVSVGVGPAGSGKTHTAAAGAHAWEARGGEVIGLTCAQAARDVLAAAGIKDSYNTTAFLLAIERGMPIAPGTLFVVDEGSTVSMAHLARIIELAEKHDCKVFVTGDHQQLAAVESGGGMAMLANHLGYTQLAVPVRFAEEWERDASLRLRAGGKAALEEYAEHGRITGGDREEALAQARQAYVAGRLAGVDTLLMAYTRDDCRVLSRMIRDDLVHLELVDGGPSVRLSEGARAAAGDLVVSRKNDSRLVTDPGHTLANGDIFRIERVERHGVWVRRALEADHETGRPRFADRAVFYGASKFQDTDLAYAVTGHNGIGGTVARGLAFITGTESLQWLYVALTRGRERYRALVIKALPEDYRQEDLGPQATWLYRTLRAAEMAGLDASDVVRAAVNARPLTGARNVASVLDARMRKIVDPLVPLPQKPWTGRPREIADPEVREYEATLRGALDARAERLGEHAVQTSPTWALQALGPVPDDPVDRLGWQTRASKIATYRELYGIGDDRDVIGPEPSGNAPEMRAAWHDAFAAITRTDSIDVRTLPDGSLMHMRDSYKTETGWAPPHVSKLLRDVRLGAETMRLKATRAEAEAKTAKGQATAARHADIATKARALEAQHREHEAVLNEVMDDRRLWDKLTQGSRQLAVQADSEIRRRHPDRRIRPLESAEPKAPDKALPQPGLAGRAG